MIQLEKDTHHTEKQQLATRACVFTAVNALLIQNKNLSSQLAGPRLFSIMTRTRAVTFLLLRPSLKFRPANQQQWSVATTAQLLHSNMATCTERA